MNRLTLLKRVLIVIGLLIGLASCSQKTEWKQKHNISFYHWKSTYNVDEEVREYTRDLECQKVYIHIFDVIKKGGVIMPTDELVPIDTNLLHADSVKFVPVVFFTNDVFTDIKPDQLRDLVYNVSSLINTIAYAGMNVANFSEVQIDCDWTQTTKENYFNFLTQLGEQMDKEISSTIRLHQVKDKDIMGVPPVKKGYLMCYATSDPRDGMKSNSILDINLLKNYTANLQSYPLDLDFALPLFSWGIVTNHQGKVKLVNGLSKADLENEGFKKIADNQYKVLEDCFLNDLYINKDFTIEVEEITPELLVDTKKYLDEKINKEYNIVYYHLSKGFLKRFSINDLN
ncbi:MAG: hypothetical protein J6Y37_09015 [Paludibacteraceae bacterium]|nr:hypothetical protein [Paludibacteraceae bacterium]